MNCDETEAIDKAIQTKLDDLKFSEAKIKRKDQMITPASLKDTVKVKNRSIWLDPSQLFSQLILLIERYDDIKPYFQYELTPIPTSLFKDNMTRKAKKASFIPALVSLEQLDEKTNSYRRRRTLKKGCLSNKSHIW